jgi:glycosyltransferase involved in cell wall biosynthesis
MPHSAKSTSALIIPAHNEEPVIGQTLRSIPPGLFSHIIVVDNGSTDKTAEVARQFGAIALRQTEKGYGAACLTALNSLPDGVEIVVFMQADGSEDPSQARNLIAPLLDGRADLVLGSRITGHAEKGSLLPHQRFGNWLATRLIRLLYGHSYTDLGPFRAIRVVSLRSLGMRDRNYGWTIEMQIRALQHRLHVMEIPVTYRLRQAGQNKVSGNPLASLFAGIKILWVLARLCLTRPRK